MSLAWLVWEISDAVDGERFAEWVEAGRAGEMEYLKRGDEAGRCCGVVQVAMPWARSVVVCALNYNAAAAAVDRCGGCEGGVDCAVCVEWEGDGEDKRWLIPTDYHDEMLPRCGGLRRRCRRGWRVRDTVLCRYGAAGGAGDCGAGGSGLDWEEYVCAESGDGFVAAAGGDCYFAADGARGVVCGCGGPVWELYAVY